MPDASSSSSPSAASTAATMDTDAAAAALQEYDKRAMKASSGEAIAYPATADERKHELQLLKQKIEYESFANEKLTRQLQFGERLFTYIWFILFVVAVALPFPNYDQVSASYVMSLGLFVLLMFGVKYQYLLAVQVYFLNLATYFYSRLNGSVYYPYLVYGFQN